MSARAERVTVKGGVVHVLGTVQGLVTEAERVRAAFAATRPAAVALGVPPEGVEGLRDYLHRDEKPDEAATAEAAAEPARERPEAPRRHPDGTLYEEDVEDPYAYDAAELLTESEAAYGLALRHFGDVKLPPRDLLLAVEEAERADVPVTGVDYSDEEYGEAFARHVSTWALFRYTRRVRRLAKRPPHADSAHAFARAWDDTLRRVKAIDAFEREREHAIAARARELASEHGNVLLVVEAAREDGVLDALRDGAGAAR